MLPGEVLVSRFVFVRCAWMKRYAGDDDDPTIGGGSFTETEPGHERYNFKVVNGKVYGRLQSPSPSGGFNLGRVDADSGGAKLVKGVLVVFVARDPKRGQRVVGWYRDGVVYAAECPAGVRQRSDVGWNIRGSASGAVLLPLDQRTWEVPTDEGGMKQTQVRYALDERGEPDVQPWMAEILKKIAKYKGENLLSMPSLDGELLDAVTKAYARSGQGGFQPDPEARRAVEQRAMDEASAHFGGPDSVCDDHLYCSYDLAVGSGAAKKYIEVKGTTGSGDDVLLTAGEVNWARSHASVLFVLHGIKLTKSGGKWKATGGTPWVIDPWVPDDADLRALAFTYKVPGALK